MINFRKQKTKTKDDLDKIYIDFQIIAKEYITIEKNVQITFLYQKALTVRYFYSLR